MMLTRIAVCAVVLSTGLNAQKSPLAPDRLAKVRAALDAIYRLDYGTAKARCQDMIREWPEDPVGYVYLARVHWQELLLEERALTVTRFTQPDFFSETPKYKAVMDREAEQRFRAAADTAIDKARKFANGRPKDPAALFLLGAAYQNEATFQISLNNAWLAAARAGNRSYHAHRDLAALDAGYADARLVTGVYNFTVGSLPWKIKWLSVLLGYQGSVARGREELEMTAAKGLIVADDARAMLALIYAREKKYGEALRRLDELRERYPENYLTHLDMAGLEIRRGRPVDAVKLLKEVLAKIDARTGSYARLEPPIVYNQLGVAYRAAGDLTSSETWLRRSLSATSAAPRSKTIAHLELGKTLDQMGRRSEALEQYGQVRKAADYAGSHREAARYLSQPYQPR